MTDDTHTSTSSPSKYDGYAAYLQSLSQSTNTHQAEGASPLASAPSNFQNTPRKGNRDDDDDDGAASSNSSGSPPLTPSTPPPPPPLPDGTLSPRVALSHAAGSFGEAVDPAIVSHDDERDVQDQEPTQQDDDDDDASSDSPQWEDFMAHYWKLPSSETLQIHAHARSIVASEDVDLKPCPMEPQLDDEPFLSPIRTGCIDIDMDGIMSALRSPSSDGTDPPPHVDLSPIKELTNVGLESARIMAKLHGGEIREDAVSIAAPLQRPSSSSSSSSQPRFSATSFVPLASPNSFDDRRSTTSNTNTNKSTSSETPHPSEAVSEWPHKISPLPSKTLIHSIGPILTRTSLRSLVMKKWSPAHWMHYGPHTLLLFRSKEQLDDWRFNPYHGKKQREYLIKLRIDFYGEMVAGEAKDGSAGTGVLGHRILPVKRKSYGKNEMDMYQFKLERWTNLGVSVLAAFASQEEAEVQILHDTISKILKSCPYGGLRNIDHMLKK